MKLSDVFVKDGYSLMAIAKDEFDDRDDVFHAIIYREKTKDYVFCHYYNIKDGTWGQGDYFLIYTNALACMCEYLCPPSFYPPPIDDKD